LIMAHALTTAMVGDQHSASRAAGWAVGRALVEIEEETEALEVFQVLARTTALECGENSMEAAEAADHVGHAYRARGEHALALRQYSDAQRIRHCHGAPASLSVRHSARVLLDKGHTSEAVAMLRQVLLSGEEEGPSAPLSASGVECVRLLGSVALALGDFDAAFDHATRVLRSMEQRHGPRSLHAAEALFATAEIMFRQGQAAEASHAFSVVREIQTLALGPIHVDVGQTVIFLGRCAGAMGDPLASSKLLQESIDILEKAAAGEDRLQRYRHCVSLADLGVLMLADAEAQAVLRGQALGRDAAVMAGLPDPEVAAADHRRRQLAVTAVSRSDASGTSHTRGRIGGPRASPSATRSGSRYAANRPDTGSSIRPGSSLAESIVAGRSQAIPSVAEQLVDMKEDVARLRVLGTTLQQQYHVALRCLQSASEMALHEYSDVEHPFVVRIQAFVRLCNDRLQTFDRQQARAAQQGEHHKLLEEWQQLQPGAQLANGDALRHRAMQKVFRLKNWA
jgi:tetratricopeptide (TPR) repeat protein